MVNLSDVLAVTDPAAAAEAARTAVGHLRLVGLRFHLAIAITNLAEALVQLGDWDAAEAEYTQAVNSYGLADMEDLTYSARLAGGAARRRQLGRDDARDGERPAR